MIKIEGEEVGEPRDEFEETANSTNSPMIKIEPEEFEEPQQEIDEMAYSRYFKINNIEREEFEEPQQECKEMAHSNIFTKDQARNIMVLRKNYQRDMKKQPSIDSDKFGEFIKIECSILQHITEECVEDRDFVIGIRIRRKVIRRIANLFEYALRRFPTDRDLLIAFVNFCRDNGQQYKVNNIIDEIVMLKPDNIHMWVAFANWHCYDCQNINAAMKVLLKGIEIHMSNTELYIEFIKIFLHFWSEYKKLTNKSESIHTKILEKLMRNTLHIVSDINFYIALLKLLETKEFINKIQDIIVWHMKMKYRVDPLMWNTIALRYYKGFYTDNDHLMQMKAVKQDMVKAQWVGSCAMYAIGLRSVPLENKKKMYELYLKFLYNTLNNCDGKMRVIITNILHTVLKKCHQEKCMSENQYLKWSNFDEKNAIKICKKGISQLIKAPQLREKHLLLLIMRNDSGEVDQAFKEGIEVLQEDALPLWMSVIRYHSIISSDDLVEAIYKNGIKQRNNVSNSLKPEYLDWITAMKGIEVAREVYWDLANQKPYCKELHTLMAKTESLQLECDFDFWRKVHKLACEQFGKEDVDVWIKYIELYLIHNKNIENLDQYVNEICTQAEEELASELVSEFRTRYDNIRK